MDPETLKARGFTRETTIHRDRKGRWWQDGHPLAHAGLRESFDGWIDRAPDGRFCLDNAINWAFITIEGPPYFVQSAVLQGNSVLLRLSGGRDELLDPTTLRVDDQDAIWCDVREGRVPARFENHAALALGEALGLDGDDAFLELTDARHPIRRVTDPMAGWTPERGHVESAP